MAEKRIKIAGSSCIQGNPVIRQKPPCLAPAGCQGVCPDPGPSLPCPERWGRKEGANPQHPAPHGTGTAAGGSAALRAHVAAPRGSTPRLYQRLVSKKEGEPRFKFLPKYKSVFPRGSKKTKVWGCVPLPLAQGTPGAALPKGSPPPPQPTPGGGSSATVTCPAALHKPCCCLPYGRSWEKAGFRLKSPAGGPPAQGWQAWMVHPKIFPSEPGRGQLRPQARGSGRDLGQGKPFVGEGGKKKKRKKGENTAPHSSSAKAFRVTANQSINRGSAPVNRSFVGEAERRVPGTFPAAPSPPSPPSVTRRVPSPPGALGWVTLGPHGVTAG
ncbi:nascent polypeptide-associated complex subunit alpha, muscle-specific form-like [Cygnus olor]|uniref:nascent polypeptide-associated complex subunit alpha, muscle-specific form-like n=1 Tax=Cygnus olor TaxID=8869 RepID=UPI001ADE1C6C|nr:nascent polypeptide-associated complex subunit alpha, muscle-specific form-like [Cygnus olor]